MVQIELEPMLDRCIETTARQEFTGSAHEYMAKRESDSELLEKLELLRRFLAAADFPRLRRQSEKHLAEGKKVRFLLRLEDGRPEYEMRVDG
jgi:hypothetical protein